MTPAFSLVSRRSQAEQGFALTEILASLAILGMMAMLLMQGIGFGRRVWESTDRRSQRIESVATAQETIRSRIEKAYLIGRFDGSYPYVDLTGRESTLSLTALPGRLSSLKVVERLELTVAGGDLVLLSAPDFGTDPLARPTRQVLLSGVRSVEFSYFGRTRSAPVRRWTTRWIEQPRSPEVIRMRVAFRESDPRAWPDLVLRPRATVDNACVLDRATNDCRGRS